MRSPLIRWIVYLIAGIGVGLLAQSPFAPPPGSARVFPRMPGPPPDLPTLLFLLGVGSVTWYVAVVALPLLLLGARRASRWNVLPAMLALFGMSATLEYFITFNGAPSSPSLDAYLPLALRQQLLPFVALVGIVAAVESRRRARDAALEVAEQRLLALTSQLQPHFLFNTLQSISTLLHRDPDAADEMLARLSDLLRSLLRHRDRPIVSLGEEIQLATLFLEIAQVRFADRLAFHIEVPAELHTAQVPLFLLQPLVENALSHGIGKRADGGRIDVTARRDGDMLEIDVSDDGAGLPAERVEGVGLTNTRARLGALGGSFALDRADGRTVARARIPWRT